jgi:hypothetical protein
LLLLLLFEDDLLYDDDDVDDDDVDVAEKTRSVGRNNVFFCLKNHTLGPSGEKTKRNKK